MENNKISGVVETILEATDFLLKKAKSERLSTYGYLVEDILNGINSVNTEILRTCGTPPCFDQNVFLEQLKQKEDDNCPEELDNWLGRVEQALNPPLLISNQIDKAFSDLLKFIYKTDFADLRGKMKCNLNAFMKKDKTNFEKTVAYYQQYPLWGKLDPSHGVYEYIDNYAHMMIDHREDLKWLYQNLADYRSKKVLLNLLTYWMTFQFLAIDQIQEKMYAQYFDYDIISCSPEEVFVDIGAYIGDSVLSYIQHYGVNCYRKMYCYEILPSNIREIQNFIQKNGLKNVVVRAKGAADRTGYMFLTDDSVSSVEHLSKTGEIQVETIPIDEDISEPVTFIKMDIEGAEESALLGCRKKIQESHPKLALSVYHNQKDLWKLAEIVHEMDPSYKFYLRYYGGNLCPSEFILYAV